MSFYRRSRTGGGTYFFTVVTYERKRVLTLPWVREGLRRAIAETRVRFPFRIDAWVLLPDHMHCVWTLPADDADFAKRWGMIKRGTSRGCGDRFRCDDADGRKSGDPRKELTLWQRRFWEHEIRSDRDLARHLDYIHWNPVKHALAERAADWPWSTFARFVRLGMYAPEWCGGEATEAEDAEFGE